MKIFASTFFSFCVSLSFLCIFVQSADPQDADQPGFSVMRRIPPAAKPGPSAPESAPAPAPVAVKPAESAPSAPSEKTPAERAPKTPPDPPAGIAASEPVPPPPARREPQTLPINPVPESPSRIASQAEPKRETVSASRTIWAVVGQQTEIPFRGNGWVYLGEQDNRSGLTYQSRRNDADGQKYLFRADTAGTYTLKFYRQDFIEDYIINEYVQVVVSENPGVAGGNRAKPGEAGGISSAGTSAEKNAGSEASAAEKSAGSAVPADYLQKAREAYTAGSYPQAIGFLDQFREVYPAGADEAWWLYGQSLEADSASRNIRSALEYYRRLVQEYPQSQHSVEAQRRIAYLERYYFNIW
ncbi:MAG: outer membrane protein assembly factor BamD [Spirochaetaceae bacterium]|jgi:hypothetical protein|nr:outer membrane protein assembly factor BamD [Spirochaetaceae bacterium]